MFRWIANTRIAALLAVTPLLAVIGNAQEYQVKTLVSNVAGRAPVTDPNLVNGWGMSRSSGSPWWISDNGTGLSTLYTGAGAVLGLVVTIPGANGGVGQPTGTMYNGSTGFQVAPNKPAVFLFCTNDGSISGWNPGVDGTHAIKMASEPNAVYPGCTIANWNGKDYMYVANVATQAIEVYDSNFNPVFVPKNAFRMKVPDEIGGFNNDKEGQSNFKLSQKGQTVAPHNIQNIGGVLYIAYTVQDTNLDEVFGPGLGFVASYTPDGKLIKVFQYGPWFNSPWGMTIAPSDFGSFSHTLLVGNLGDGTILGFNLATGQFVGKLNDQNGDTIEIPGLWGIGFGNGATAGPYNTLYFAAGPDDEMNGAFGSITPVAADLIQGNDQ